MWQPVHVRWLSATCLAALLGFVGGAGWRHVEVERLARQVAESDEALAMRRLEATLAAAVIEAQRGEFDAGQQMASTFFMELQRRVVNLPPDTLPELDRLLARRDIVIAALARGGAGAAGSLAETLVDFRAAAELEDPLPGTPRDPLQADAPAPPTP